MRRGLFLINSALNGAGACFAEYNRVTGTFGLVNDAGTGWAYASLAASMSVGNSQCQVTGGSVAYSGNSMLLTVQITFKSAFASASPKTTWLLSEDLAGVQTVGSWQPLGTFTVVSSGFSKPTATRSAVPLEVYTFNDGSEVWYTYTITAGADLNGFQSCSTSGSGVTTRFEGIVPGQSEIIISYSASVSAVAGSRTVTCTWYGQTVQIQGGLNIYDATPRIDSMTPSIFQQSPAEIPVTFTGAGFGTLPPTLAFSPANISWRIGAGNTTNQFTAYVIAPIADNYTVTVLSNGTSGSGFQAGGGSQRGSNQRSLTVTQGNVTLSVSFRGQPVGPGQIVSLPVNDPVAQITANLSGAIGGTVAWRLRAQYKDANDAGPEFEESYPFGPLPLLPVGTPWSVAASVGGTLTVEWSLNGGPTQTGFQFTVLGNDPGRQVITSCTNEPWCVGNEPWFFTRLIMQESTWQQFVNGRPKWGYPHGYGLMQLDPSANLATLFDWRQNLQEGKAKLEDKRLIAIDWWEDQKGQWQRYNESHPGAEAPMHGDQQEGLVLFTGTGTPGAVSFQDAVWIKAYNFGRPHYISWLPEPQNTWNINNLAGSPPRNYVALVCSKQP